MGEVTARARPIVRPEYDVVVRPRAALLRSTALSVLFSAVPLGVALVWVSFPMRLWALVATVVLVLVVLAGLLLVRFRTAFVGIGPRMLELRGVLSPNVQAERASVDRVVLATTYGGSVDRTTRELLALSVTGDLVFRMRGLLWDDAEIARVASTLDVQITDLGKPMPIREFYRRFPASRAWYERRRGIVTVGVVVALCIAAALAVETTGLIAA